jgi:ribosomal protein S18 acetylase RimI-like enzyme
MRRPADQAKVLFFYLLRSSAAALASTQQSAANSAAKLLLQPHEGHICLRLARRNDVVPMQRCNFATLPENYNANFFDRQLKTFPDLALVAEHVPPDLNNKERRFQNPAFPGLNTHESKVIGYVLGKVEEQPSTSGVHLLGDSVHTAAAPCTPTTTLGHVISLAVLQDYRRHGLAAALMNQLHFHLEQVYGAQCVSLHVRKSNEAAWRLYERDGYIVESVIPDYYEDGEDAYFMRKALRPPMTTEKNYRKRAWGRPRPWEHGPLEFRLPRNQAFRNSPNGEPVVDEGREISPGQPQVMTGTM